MMSRRQWREPEQNQSACTIIQLPVHRWAAFRPPKERLFTLTQFPVHLTCSFFGLWEEPEEPGEKSSSKRSHGRESNPKPSGCEAAAATSHSVSTKIMTSAWGVAPSCGAAVNLGLQWMTSESGQRKKACPRLVNSERLWKYVKVTD